METQELIIRAADDWTPEAEQYIAAALSTASLDDIKRQVMYGARLFGVYRDGAMVAAFVLRVDRQACRNVGVVVAAGGGAQGIDLTAQLLPHIETMFYGCETVRVHTERRGLVKKLAAQGYRTEEIILEKRLTHG